VVECQLNADKLNTVMKSIALNGVTRCCTTNTYKTKETTCIAYLCITRAASESRVLPQPLRLKCVKLYVDREICVRRVHKTRINITRALTLPKEQQRREHK
jgi:hypothetical protein